MNFNALPVEADRVESPGADFSGALGAAARRTAVPACMCCEQRRCFAHTFLQPAQQPAILWATTEKDRACYTPAFSPCNRDRLQPGAAGRRLAARRLGSLSPARPFNPQGASAALGTAGAMAARDLRCVQAAAAVAALLLATLAPAALAQPLPVGGPALAAAAPPSPSPGPPPLPPPLARQSYKSDSATREFDRCPGCPQPLIGASRLPPRLHEPFCRAQTGSASASLTPLPAGVWVGVAFTLMVLAAASFFMASRYAILRHRQRVAEARAQATTAAAAGARERSLASAEPALAFAKG